MTTDKPIIHRIIRWFWAQGVRLLIGASPVEISFAPEKDWDMQVSELLRKRGYVERVIKFNGTRQLGYQKGFVSVCLTQSSCCIGHDIGGNGEITKFTEIKNPMATLTAFLQYFERL